MTDQPGFESGGLHRPDPDEKLVKVFDTEHEPEAMVVKGLLDSMGIDCDLTSIDAIQESFPGVGGTIILVRAADAERARQLIDAAAGSPLDEDEATTGA